MTNPSNDDLLEKLDKLIEIAERMAPPAMQPIPIDQSDAFIWEPGKLRLVPVHKVNRVEFDLLKGIEHVSTQLLSNTQQFFRGFSANNALLWGARGMGKSSLVKAVHHKINQDLPPQDRLILIEIHREDIDSLPLLLGALSEIDRRILLYCDDLSFDHDDSSYKSLKAALDGGIEGRPENVIFYATSNRRHLLPRDMIENERSTAINPSEAVEEKVSLSDRFGLWLGFHKCDQDAYLSMIDGYATYFDLEIEPSILYAKAIEWATTRGSRSGRTAWQFIEHISGTLGKNVHRKS